jgi:hypothetical protein
LEFDYKKIYRDVYITIRLSADVNKILTESSARSHRKKLQEARLRLEDHLVRFHSISERGSTVSDKNRKDANSLFEKNN